MHAKCPTRSYMLLSYRQPEKDIEFVNIMLSEFPEFVENSLSIVVPLVNQNHFVDVSNSLFIKSVLLNNVYKPLSTSKHLVSN
jgi:hypothetical protein